jgi:hypothetical protein
VTELTDWEWSLREWVRDQLPSVKTWFEPPKGSPSTPMITISGQIGGGPDAYLPIDSPRVSFSIWGPPGGDGRKAAGDIMRDLVHDLDNVNGPLDDETYCYGASGIGIIWAPDRSDPDNVLPRYIVDATLTTRAV